MAMNETVSNLITAVIAFKPKQGEFTEALIKKTIDICSNMMELTTGRKVSQWDKDEVFKQVTTMVDVHIDRGVALIEQEHHPWYMNAKKNIDGTYWNSYCLLLKEKHWLPEVINEMDDETNEIMDLLGNPKQSEGFQRRGLCIGDVQSGKTANYIGLMNKAADAGYKVIILLTGVIEKLRSQTQARVDEGFIGSDSNVLQQYKAQNNKNRPIVIGVGKFRMDKTIDAACFTSKSRDFKSEIANTLPLKIGSVNGTAVFVLKKNKDVLENLYGWLKSLNSGKGGRINEPLLLIDDEADNASVNTRKPEDATRINRDIRQLLTLFTKSSYVGYTATPYANIFIDPDTDDEMLKEDLFPRHFIYCLPAPTNYIGPSSLFLNGEEADERWKDDGKYSKELKDIDDCESYLPLKHNSGVILGKMPETLKNAILSFFLVNAIRDLRKDTSSHRTMMINISRLIYVQNQIRDDVASFVKDCINDIGNYYMLNDGTDQSEVLAELKSLYETDFYGFSIPGKKSEINFDWMTIQHALKNAVVPIQVEAVNGGNASRKLDYDDNPEGKRLIAIGGLSLSRGLTLEGLCVSYFYRNSKTYDTLMQMGRWFGYRPSYDDLCRVWMSEDSQEWYREITLATRELKQRLIRMRNENRTPEDFGLCVRQDNMALLVTARNKMKTAKDFSRKLNLSGNVVETSFLSNNTVVLESNFESTDSFIKLLIDKGYEHIHDNDEYASRANQFLNVDGQDVADYLIKFKSNPLNFDFIPTEIVQAVSHAESISRIPLKWDVIIAQGKETADTIKIGGLTIPVAKRHYSYRKEYKVLQMSGKNAHLGSKDLSKAGMKKTVAQTIEKRNMQETGKTTSARTYFQYREIKRNPVLMIYPLKLEAIDKLTKDLSPRDRSILEEINNRHPLIGLGIGMPVMKGMESVTANYKINKQMQKEIFGVTPDEDFEEVDDTVEE